MHKVTKEEYQQARDLIATPGRWCRGDFVKSASQHWSWETVVDDSTARFCAVGALFAVCGTNLCISEHLLNKASEDLFDEDIIYLNDDWGLDKVLQAYDHLLVNWDYYNEAK